jgi:hypothetical protein
MNQFSGASSWLAGLWITAARWITHFLTDATIFLADKSRSSASA